MVVDRRKGDRRECRMSGCDEYGLPNYTCYTCKRVEVYFCDSCTIEGLLSNLRHIGREVITCPDCLKAKRGDIMIKQDEVHAKLEVTPANAYQKAIYTIKAFEEAVTDLMQRCAVRNGLAGFAACGNCKAGCMARTIMIRYCSED